MNFNVMSDRGFLGVIIFCALGLSSCSLKKDDAQKTLVEMSKHKVVLPLGEMGCFHSAVDTVERKDIAPMKYNFVHYVDSSQCSPCALDRMYHWNKLIDDYSKKGVNFVFIIEPKKEQIEDVHFAIESSGLRNPVYVDSLYAFRRQNSFLSEDQMYHSFLLNKKGKIILVGNPLENDDIKQLLNKLVKHNKYEKSIF